MHSFGGYNGYCDHDQSTGTPHVFGEELFHLDVPEPLPEQLVHVARQGLVSPLQHIQFHLVQKIFET